jgi:transglutaminase superfamily protein
MFKVTRRWQEIGDDGAPVDLIWAEFKSIPEQLQFLRTMIDVYRATEWSRQMALRIVKEAGCADRHHACMALAVGEWVQRNIRYVREFPERFQSPSRTVKDAAGDCDDFTTLIGSLLESIGIQVEVVGMKVGQPPGGRLGERIREAFRLDTKWKHVYPRALIDTGGGRPVVMNLDATLRNTPVRQLANPIRRALERGLKVDTLVL